MVEMEGIWLKNGKEGGGFGGTGFVHVGGKLVVWMKVFRQSLSGFEMLGEAAVPQCMMKRKIKSETRGGKKTWCGSWESMKDSKDKSREEKKNKERNQETVSCKNKARQR